MKTATAHHSHCTVRTKSPFPNAATRHQIVSHILDLTLTFMLGAGAAAVVLFVLALA